MAHPDELAALSLTIARHELAEMRARVLDASGGDHEVVREAADIVKETDADPTASSPEHLAFELLAAAYKQITERETARRRPIPTDPSSEAGREGNSRKSSLDHRAHG
jgi:hypothetical protein